ncbi:unnamed protein product [Clonostachys rosea]|uniref:Fungal N-terminal domain-containing protein n=1 Tax=Bionectria ochroleuca TaxID=29856 RepID=A0ABY6USC1_BIOOC|nr:unnamed protein product [Clonostachys rosea]
MDGFSVTSLTSLCDTISHAAVSTNTELSDLMRAIPNEKAQQSFTSLYGSLQILGNEITQLQKSLTQASVLSESLRGQLQEHLSDCQKTLGSLNKQVLRVDSSLVDRISHTYLSTRKEYFASYCQLLRFFTTTLHINDIAQQDAALKSTDGESASSLVNDASKSISKFPEILQDETGAAPSYESVSAGSAPAGKAGGDELPPAYENVTNPGADEPEEGGFDLTSLKHSWKALTSGFSWFKPDPLVTALCEASLRGDVKQVAGLLQQGANIDGRNDKSMTPLACAVKANQADVTRFLLSAGANDKTGAKIPPLFEAAAAGSLEVARVFLERGAKASEKSISGHSYFYDVVNGDGTSLEGVRFLLQHGATVDMTSTPGRLPIVCAVKKNRLDLLKLLLEYGAAANSTDYTGSSVISLAIDQDPNSEMVDLLLQRGAPANSKTISGQPIIAVAVSKRSLPLTRKLLERGAKGDAKDISGSPVIINVIKDTHLSEAERTEYVRLLLLHGASVKVKDIAGQAPVLHHAMQKSNGDIVALLLHYGADTTKNMSNGESLLCNAITNGRLDQVSALLKYKTNPNTPNSKGQSPLMMALIKQDLKLIHLLRKHGADINQDERAIATVLGRSDIRQALGLDAPAGGPSSPRSPTNTEKN